MEVVDQDTTFAELVRPYENLWVAIDERDGVEFIVGQGKDALEAAKDAEAKGYPNAMLFKVPSFSSSFIPSARSTVSPAVSY